MKKVSKKHSKKAAVKYSKKAAKKHSKKAALKYSKKAAKKHSKKAALKYSKKAAVKHSKKAALKMAKKIHTSSIGISIKNNGTNIKKTFIRNIRKLTTSPSKFYLAEFLSFLNSLNKNDIKIFLGMILTGKIEIANLRHSESEKIYKIFKNEFKNLSLEDKIIAKRESEILLSNLNKSPDDLCQQLGLCEIIVTVKEFKKFKEDEFLKKIKSKSKVLKVAIDAFIERCEEIAGLSLSGISIEFTMIILIAKLGMGAIEDFCECENS